MPAIDLSMNLPPQPDGADLDARLAATLAEIRRQAGFAPYLTYQQAGGSRRGARNGGRVAAPAGTRARR